MALAQIDGRTNQPSSTFPFHTARISHGDRAPQPTVIRLLTSGIRPRSWRPWSRASFPPWRRCGPPGRRSSRPLLKGGWGVGLFGRRGGGGEGGGEKGEGEGGEEEREGGRKGEGGEGGGVGGWVGMGVKGGGGRPPGPERTGAQRQGGSASGGGGRRPRPPPRRKTWPSIMASATWTSPRRQIAE